MKGTSGATTRIALLASVLPCLSCATAPDARGGPGTIPTAIQLDSVFVSQQQIPAAYTCEGDEVSPPLRWSQVPDDARSLVLIVDDGDAQAYTHWLLYNLPPSAELSEGAASALPRGASDGKNDGHTTGYRGPCPQSGRHHYSFKIFALDTTLTGLDAPTRQQVEAAMQGHIVAEGTLVGTYQRAAPE